MQRWQDLFALMAEMEVIHQILHQILGLMAYDEAMPGCQEDILYVHLDMTFTKQIK